jgi:nucleoid-associated protein YgaU
MQKDHQRADHDLLEDVEELALAAAATPRGDAVRHPRKKSNYAREVKLGLALLGLLLVALVAVVGYRLMTARVKPVAAAPADKAETVTLPASRPVGWAPADLAMPATRSRGLPSPPSTFKRPGRENSNVWAVAYDTGSHDDAAPLAPPALASSSASTSIAVTPDSGSLALANPAPMLSAPTTLASTTTSPAAMTSPSTNPWTTAPAAAPTTVQVAMATDTMSAAAVPPSPQPSDEPGRPRYGQSAYSPPSSGGFSNAASNREGVLRDGRDRDDRIRDDKNRDGDRYSSSTAATPQADSTTYPSAYSGGSRYRSSYDANAAIRPAGMAGDSLAGASTLAPRSADAGLIGNGAYKVQPNDSYWTIAEKVYGSGAYFKALAEANREKNPREDRLQVGTTLVAPPIEVLQKRFPDLCPKPKHHRPPASHLANVSMQGSALGRRSYVVEPGDTLFDIARHELGRVDRWAEIYELNRDKIGEDTDYLVPGTRLALPESRDGRQDGSRVADRSDAFPRR